jgi:hypothetical protein
MLTVGNYKYSSTFIGDTTLDILTVDVQNVPVEDIPKVLVAIDEALAKVT